MFLYDDAFYMGPDVMRERNFRASMVVAHMMVSRLPTQTSITRKERVLDQSICAGHTDQKEYMLISQAS